MGSKGHLHLSLSSVTDCELEASFDTSIFAIRVYAFWFDLKA